MKPIEVISLMHDDFIDRASAIALAEIEKMARYVLAKNPKKADSFCMAMGSFSFHKDHHALWDHQCEKLIGYNKLNKFIFDLPEALGITGHPMQFTATSELITDW